MKKFTELGKTVMHWVVDNNATFTEMSKNTGLCTMTFITWLHGNVRGKPVTPSRRSVQKISEVYPDLGLKLKEYREAVSVR